MDQSGYLNDDFQTCLSHLMEKGLEANPRGTKTKELLNYNITLLDPRNRVITFPDRKTNRRYLLGELIWYITGRAEAEFITPYSKFWGNITNSGDYDGYRKDTVNSNYGNRILGYCDLDSFTDNRIEMINQWEETVALLKKDPDTRQAIMNIHVPSDRHAGNKDVPCTLTLQWMIRENSLHLIVNMRSNDIILGFTNDVFQFTMLQEIMLLDLRGNGFPDLELGHYFHNAGSMHIYDRHFQMAYNIIDDIDFFDYSMAPMDRWDNAIYQALLQIEKDFRESGFSEDFDFDSHPQFEDLSPYWKHVVLGFFGNYETSMEWLHNGNDQIANQDTE